MVQSNDINDNKTVYIIAGEASGDVLGADLIRALKHTQPDIRVMGIGGPLMEAEGLQSLFPMKELSLMGLFEIAPKIISILKRIKQTIEDVEKIKPDYLITIDAPDFSFRVQKAIKQKPIQTKQFHYVAPTVWAWRAGRAKKVAQFLDGMICLFDFEPAYFEKEGLKSIAVGHPMMRSDLVSAPPAQVGGNNVKKLGLFFGSRVGEVKRHGEIFIDALRIMRAHSGSASQFEVIVPTLPHLKNQIEDLMQRIDIPFYISTDSNQKHSMMKACDAAIAVSGTVGLELAVANIPHTIGYRMNALTWKIVHRVIRTPYAHLANIIMDKRIVPEFIQHECEANRIAVTALKLMNDEQVRIAQQNAFDEVRHKLGEEKNPSQIATDFILSQ